MADDPARPVRVRIAPSPTGNCHVGTARSALVNLLFARPTASDPGTPALPSRFHPRRRRCIARPAAGAHLPPRIAIIFDNLPAGRSATRTIF